MSSSNIPNNPPPPESGPRHLSVIVNDNSKASDIPVSTETAAEIPAQGPKDRFTPAPTLFLRSDIGNPIRTDPLRRIESLGDVWDGLRQDLVAKRLRVGKAGAQVFIPLGSAWGDPKQPLSQTNLDKKPDMMVIGNSEVILNALQPMQGWNGATLRENKARAKQGMVYFNDVQDTPQGPIRFKIGILDDELWRKGSHPYFDLRVSMLPANESSFQYLSEEAGGNEITASEFESWLRKVQADYMRRSIETFLLPSDFSAEDLVERRYHNQFFNYELYRVFDWFKGKKQADRYAAEIPQIFTTAVKDYLNTHPNLLEAHHPDLGTIAPEQITAENFLDLRFSWKQDFLQRVPNWWRSHKEFLQINGQMVRQTFRNIGSNGTSRPGYHKVHWLEYGYRKFSRLVGYDPTLTPRTYTPQASFFPDAEARLGRVENPLEEMIILSGYPPKNENDKEVYNKEIRDYFEAEIVKGLKPNLILLGNHPSKFALPVQGVPIVAFALMQGLRSPIIKHMPVVGVPEVGVVTEAFKKHFADEIRQKGMTIEFHDVGLEGGSYATNIQKGLDNRGDKSRMAILRPGDTPLVDLHNTAYHPWRNSLDFIIGANGRNLVFDYMGMNAHYTQYVEGVPYDFKEGNGQGVLTHLTELVNEIYQNRKSVQGAGKKVGIIVKFAGEKLARLQTLDTLLVDLPLSVVRSSQNWIRKALGYPAPKWAWDFSTIERGTPGHLDWKIDLQASHLDPGSLIDVDGLRDYLLVEMLTRALPPDYLKDLQEFSNTTLKPYLPELPAMTDNPKRINQLMIRVYNEILELEAKRPPKERLHIDADRLKRNGVDPDNLPFTETGEFNPEWIKIILPEKERARYIRAFQAYFNRGEHAKNLKQGFLERIELRRPWPPSGEALAELEKSESSRQLGEGQKPLSPGKKRALEQSLLYEVSKFPQYYEGQILEWDFNWVRDSLVAKAQKRYKEFSQEVDYIKDYFRLSMEKNYDTPLRRLLMGVKAVEAARRYHPLISAEEYRELFPLLEQHAEEAAKVLSAKYFPKNRAQGLGDYFLGKYFNLQKQNFDRLFVRKVGESPPPYQKRGVGRVLSHSNSIHPLQYDKRGRVRSAETAAWLPRDINLFSRRLDILPERIPDVIAEAAWLRSRGDLENIPTERLTMERTLKWVQTETGQNYLKNNQSYLGDHFNNRLKTYGPGLGIGIATLFGAERAADYLGLDPVRSPHERFMFVVGASHLTATSTQYLLEPLTNALRGNPYRFVTQKSLQAGGEAAMAFRFHASDGILGGMWNSWARNYQLGEGIPKVMWNGAKGLVTLPVRTGWNMGAGLMAAALTDQWVSEKILHLDQDSSLRKKIHLASFFLPDAARIAMGNRIPVLFRNPLTQGASRVFAAGFLGDLAFSAGQRIKYGNDGAVRKSMIYQRAKQLHDEARKPGLAEGLFEMVAPQLAAWWDSVSFNGSEFVPNFYQKKATQEVDQYFSQANSSAASLTLNGPSGRELPLKNFIEDMSRSAKLHVRFQSLYSPRQQRQFVQNRYSGWSLSEEDAKLLLQQAAQFNQVTGILPS